jgi:hypothetical protein
MQIQPWHVRKINLYLLQVTLIIFAWVLFNTFKKNEIESSSELLKPTIAIPRSFESPNASQTILEEKSFLSLQAPLFKAHLPDIRTSLVFHGVQKRPDIKDNGGILLFAIRGASSIKACRMHEKVFLQYDSKNTLNNLNFAENGKKTPLWFEAELVNNELMIHVKLQTTKGTIETPDELAHFSLPQERTLANVSVQHLELDGSRIDGSYFFTEKATWYGQDIFMKLFGGPEFDYTNGRERIEFGKDNRYACFVKPGEWLVYENGEWKEASEDVSSLRKPILYAKTTTHNSMLFELWDADGKQKMDLTLVRSQETPITLSVENMIKLVGARSKKDWIAEIQGKRLLVRANDWFLFANNTLEKIDTKEMLEDYLSGRLKGELLIFEGAAQGQKDALIGKIFNSSRTQASDCVLSFSKSWEHIASPQELDEEDEDMEDDDEEQGRAGHARREHLEDDGEDEVDTESAVEDDEDV